MLVTGMSNSSLLRNAPRAFFILLAVVGVAWPVVVFPCFKVSGSGRDVISRILDDQHFKSEVLADLLTRFNSTGWLLPQSELWRATAFLKLSIAEEAARSSASNDVDAKMESAQSALVKVLSTNPSEAFLWLKLYSLKNSSEGFDTSNNRYLQESYSAVPLDAWVALKRNRLALSVFSGLGDDMQAKVVAEFAALVDSGFIDIAMQNLIGPGWPQKDTLLKGLAQIDLIPREAFAKRLVSRGVNVQVPGVKTDERPWQ